MENFSNSYALLIGASSKGEEYMADDAKAIKEVLLNKKYAGYPNENVILLTDKKTNRKNILKAFYDFAKKLNKDKMSYCIIRDMVKKPMTMMPKNTGII